MDVESSIPELFEKVKKEGAKTLASFREQLETEDVLDWDFNFWDVEDNRRIRKKVEHFNNVCKDVYVIFILDVDTDPTKRRRLQSGLHAKEVDVPIADGREFPVQDESGRLESIDPIGSSRISGLSGATAVESNNNVLGLTSSLIPPEAINRYHAQVEKLCRDLKDSNLDDHKWELLSND